MEEIASTEVLEREILDDARRKAERVLRDADAAVRAAEAAGRDRAARSVGELEAEYEARDARYRNETLARLPLERARIKAAHVDARLRAALDGRLSTHGGAGLEALVAGILARAVSRLDEGPADSPAGEPGAPSGLAPKLFPAGAELRYRGLSRSGAERLAKEALPGLVLASAVEDASLPAPGLAVASFAGPPEEGGRRGPPDLSIHATLDLLAERLLDEHRGELAAGLCAEALAS
ncbi:MAG: hypothetical protein JNG85_10920 [Spirochaetaceae bacterium]|nr:hypothetical protein [Spirochaetaceae bacterium]